MCDCMYVYVCVCDSLFLCWITMSQMLRLEQGSTPVVGSSRTTNREPPMKAMEIDSLRFMPPDRVPTRLCLCAYMPVSSKILVGESMKSIKHGAHVNILFLCIYNPVSKLYFLRFHQLPCGGF